MGVTGTQGGLGRKLGSEAEAAIRTFGCEHRDWVCQVGCLPQEGGDTGWWGSAFPKQVRTLRANANACLAPCSVLALPPSKAWSWGRGFPQLSLQPPGLTRGP